MNSLETAVFLWSCVTSTATTPGRTEVIKQLWWRKKSVGVTYFFLSENFEFSTIQALPVLFCSTEKEAPCAPETLLVYSTAFWPTLAALVKHSNSLPGTGQQNVRYLQCRCIWLPHGLIISHFATDARLRFAFTTDNLFCCTLLLLLRTSAELLAMPTANRAARPCSVPWGGGRYPIHPRSH